MNFNIVGRLKKSDKQFERVAESQKGAFQKFNTSANAGGNIVFLHSQYWDSKTYKKEKVYYMTKTGDKAECPYSERFDKNHLDEAAEYSKFIIDANPSGYVYGLEKLVNGWDDASDEDKTKFKVETKEDAEKKLESASKKRQEFLDVQDYTEALNKFFNDNDVEKGKWFISGCLSFRESNGKWYSSYEINKIQRVSESKEEYATVSIGTTKNEQYLFLNNCITADTDKVTKIKGYVTINNKDKEGNKFQTFCPIEFEIPKDDEKNTKIANLIKKRLEFEEDEENKAKEFGLILNIMNGAQKVEFTEDMLTDIDRENIEAELTTFEEIQKQRTTYGDRKQGFSYKALGKDYPAPKDSAYTKAKVLGIKENSESDDFEDDFDDFEDID